MERINSYKLERSAVTKTLKIVDLLPTIALRGKDNEVDLEAFKNVENVIVVPDYQRNMLKEKNDKFVPSLYASVLLLIGVPSSIVLAYNEDGHMEIIDGLQRVSGLIDIYLKNVPFKKSKVNLTMTEEEETVLSMFENMTLSDIEKTCPELYEVIMNLEITVNTYSGFDRDARIALFEKLNVSSSALTKDEINHALFQGTPIYKVIEGMSKKCDDLNSQYFGQIIDFVSNNTKYKRDNYLAKLSVSVCKKITEETYSRGYTQLVRKFFEDKTLNDVANAENLEFEMLRTLKVIKDYDLRPLLNQVNITPVGTNGKKLKKSSSTFLFSCLFYFASKEEDILKEAEKKNVDIIDTLNLYIDNDNFRKSALANANYQHTDTTGKVIVNAVIWKRILRDYLDNGDKNINSFDFDESEKDIRSTLGGK